MAKFNTERLKELTQYAIQGAGFDKLLDLSTYMGIRIKDNTLYLNTTDGTNYLRVSDRCVADDMDITVDAELFSKLISKLNSAEVELQLDNNTLIVSGNGKYTIALQLNENGELLSFSDKFPVEVETVCTISAVDVVKIASAVKASLGSDKDTPYYNYYFGDVVASTDKAMMSIFNLHPMKESCLLDRSVIDNMLCSGKDVMVSKTDNQLIFESSIGEEGLMRLCTVKQSAEGFNVDAIRKFAELDVKSFCRFKKVEMLNLLDRLALFVTKFEDGVVELHFTDSYVEVSSLSNSGIERVEYTESKDAEDVTIKINIIRLRNQLKAYNADIVDLYYGNEICIKLVDGDMTQLIALVK